MSADLPPAFSRFQSASGVKVAPECLEAFQSLKTGKKLKYIIFKLSPDNTEIVVSKTSESSDYDSFLEQLTPGECCYAVYDVEYQKGEEGKRRKICFYTWYVIRRTEWARADLLTRLLPLPDVVSQVPGRFQGQAEDAVRFVQGRSAQVARRYLDRGSRHRHE